MAAVRRSLTPHPDVPSADGAHAMRRSDPRMEASERLTLTSGERVVEGWSLNASRGGIRIISEEPLELGEELLVRVGEGDSGRPGRVVWVQDEPDGCIAGLAYLDVPREDEE